MKGMKIMKNQAAENENLSVLNAMYKNSAMGVYAIEQVLKKTTDAKLKGELNAQLANYKNDMTKLEEEIHLEKGSPEGISAVAKAMTGMSVMLDTMKSDSTSHIAEMMIQGTNMGVIDLVKEQNHCANAGQNIKDEVNSMLQREQQYIDKLKPFL